MTAPSLLDELEEVVRLAEKATPGPWLYRSKSNSWHKPPQQGTVYSYGEHIVGMDSDDEADNGWDEAFLIAAVQFMTAHHAELADMAKRMETAERDAATERAIQNAADKLPDGYAISLYVENGSGYIDLTDPEGAPVPVDTDDRSMADQITQATKVAIDAAAQEAEG